MHACSLHNYHVQENYNIIAQCVGLFVGLEVLQVYTTTRMSPMGTETVHVHEVSIIADHGLLSTLHALMFYFHSHSTLYDNTANK